MRGPDKKQIAMKEQRRIIDSIAQDNYSESFLLYNSDTLLNKFQSWKKTFPWIAPHYAIKSNPIKPMLDDLVTEGSGFDCASKREIKTVLNLGVHPNKIVYSNSIKNEKDILYAVKKGVTLTTCDTIEEIEKVQRLAPEMKILWRISIKEENPEKLSTLFSGKFGDDIVSVKDAVDRFKQIKKMGVTLEGIHFHCGSGQQGSTSFQKAIDLARSCMEVGRKCGHNMETLDIGGGYPAGAIPEITLNALKQTQDDPLGYRVIAEPGRHFSANSCTLATRVIGKRIKNGQTCYHVNDSLYHSFNCVLMDGAIFGAEKDAFYDSWELEENRRNHLEMVTHNKSNGTLFGMTCDGLDVIAKNISMPEMNVGDWIVVGGMGAYTYGVKSLFNGMSATQRVVTLKNEDRMESYMKFKL